MTKWLVANTDNVEGGKIEHMIKEKPLLHCCCAEDPFGDVRLDIRPEVHPDIVHDITEPLEHPMYSPKEFGAAFADFPWVNSWKWNAAKAIKNMLRVAPVVYTISPWLYGGRICTPESVSVSWRPGMNAPILFVRYVRNEPFDELLEKMERANSKKLKPVNL